MARGREDNSRGIGFVRLDRHLYRAVQRRLRSAHLTPILVPITHSGTKGAVWLLLAALVFAFAGAHGRWVAVESVAALLLAEGLINIILKPAVARERPYVRYGGRRLLVPAPGAHSWPSAHAGSSLAAGLVLAVGLYPWGVAALILALVIAASRVYVGVHYPLDVLGGGTIGLGCGVLVLLISHLVPGLP